MIYHTEENSQLKNSFSETFRELKLPSLLHHANIRKADGFYASEVLLLVFFQRSLIQFLKKMWAKIFIQRIRTTVFWKMTLSTGSRLLLLLAAKVTSYFQG